MSTFHQHKSFSACLIVLAMSGCTTVEGENDIASRFLDDELKYYESDANLIEGREFLVETLQYGVSFPGFRDDLQYALSRTSENDPWMVMLSFEANSQSYSIHHWHSLPESGQWHGIGIQSFGETPSEFVELDETKVDGFMDDVRAENCFDLSRKFMLHSRVYFITIRSAPDSVRRFVIKEPGAAERNTTESITYQNLGEDSDGSTKSGTITYQSDWEKGECYDTLSEYVDFIESAFSENE